MGVDVLGYECVRRGVVVLRCPPHRSRSMLRFHDLFGRCVVHVIVEARVRGASLNDA